MTFQLDGDHRRHLEPDQIAHARQLLHSGWAIVDVARDCGLKVPQLQAQLGLPQWADLPEIGGAV